MCLAALMGDSDNALFGMVKDGFMPSLVVLECSVKYRRTYSPVTQNADLRYN